MEDVGRGEDRDMNLGDGIYVCAIKLMITNKNSPA